MPLPLPSPLALFAYLIAGPSKYGNFLRLSLLAISIQLLASFEC